MKKISIMGSTGSIGKQTLQVIDETGGFEVTALSCGSDIVLLEEQIRKYKPKMACVYNEDKAKELKCKVSDLDTKILTGMDGLIEAASGSGADVLLAAIVGMMGIKPTIAAINAGLDIAFANKETLVTAGHIIMPLIKEKGVKLLPVDSEHSAIFQCLHGEKGNPLEKILLTCSGGPFRGKSLDELKAITPADALKHPKWNMGKKITIDSATLVNKGLEVMEAMWLFDTPFEKIEVVVHPQSVIHSMVQFEDGSIKAQLGSPDMRVPIEYALFYPERKHLSVERVDFFKLQHLTFEKPDLNTFKGLRLAFDALKAGGSAPTVYNAANEEAVKMFLSGELSFLGIADSIEKALDTVKLNPNPSLDEVLEIEKETRELVKSFK